jgi:3-oxoadipate enol-lactonase
LDHTLYREQKALASKMRLLLPDYPGVGKSPLAETPVYTMDFLADLMLKSLDAAGCPQAVMLGTSLGGYVALALWARAPQRVLGLILANTRAENDTPAQALGRRETAERLRQEGTEFMRERLGAMFGETTQEKHPELVGEFQDKLAAFSAEGLARLTLGLADRPDRREMLAGIRVPVLLLGGAEDAVTPPEGMRVMARCMPGADFRILPEAGHLSALEQPRAFNAAVAGFVHTLDVPGRGS